MPYWPVRSTRPSIQPSSMIEASIMTSPGKERGRGGARGRDGKEGEDEIAAGQVAICRMCNTRVKSCIGVDSIRETVGLIGRQHTRLLRHTCAHN